jgi:hypothetical protein
MGATTMQSADEIAFEWLTAGGLNNSDAIDALMTNWTPAEMAHYCASEWTVHVAADELAAAFSRFAINRPDKA